MTRAGQEPAPAASASQPPSTHVCGGTALASTPYSGSGSRRASSAAVPGVAIWRAISAKASPASPSLGSLGLGLLGVLGLAASPSAAAVLAPSVLWRLASGSAGRQVFGTLQRPQPLGSQGAAPKEHGADARAPRSTLQRLPRCWAPCSAAGEGRGPFSWLTGCAGQPHLLHRRHARVCVTCQAAPRASCHSAAHAAPTAPGRPSGRLRPPAWPAQRHRTPVSSAPVHAAGFPGHAEQLRLSFLCSLTQLKG